MNPWTAERIALLTDLWNIKGLSASECGAVLKITRDAVIGKVHRIPLLARKNPVKQYAPGESRPAVQRSYEKRAAARREILGSSSHEDTAIRPYSALSAESVHTCQFIAGEPRDPKCGQRTQAGSSYCPPHHARCWHKAAGRGAL